MSAGTAVPVALLLAGEGRRIVGEPLPSAVVVLAGLALLVTILVAGALVRRRSGGR